MAEVRGYVCLETIIDEFLNDEYNGERGHYFQLLKWAIRGLMKLNFSVLINKKVEKVAVENEPYGIILPEDYVKFHSVGIVKYSKFIPFAKSSNRTLTTTEDCGLETQNTDEESVPPSNNSVRYVPTYTYTLDEENNRILLDGFPKLTEAVLIYQPTGVNTGKETYLPIKAQEALIAWLHLQKAQHTTKTAFAYQTALQRFQMEVNLLGKMRISIKNLYEVARDVYYQKLLS